MELHLKGRTALITGASSGIGVGVARILASEGARVAITARRDNELEQTASQIAASIGQAPIVVSGDITEPTDVARIAAESATALGHIDILVNCAGASRPTEPSASDDHWDEAFALNFSAARRLTQAILPEMRARHWGRVINLSGSMEPRSLNAATAAKAALHLWAKGLSCDVADEGITINTIAPGRINSNQVLNRLHPTDKSRQEFIFRNIPIGYFGEPEDIGHLVAFLASPLARYITGAVIPVDGGMHFFAH
ncbi:SDR family oxidoreductase [Pseudomonas sp. 5Ae-yellow]|uniref:SDR family NAD(P)-dependent oxidoreductase n=1 Tax=Pseudomonas sp. 5Ae-yellow TaxID=2759848 RepID=UPI0015F51CDC|nr:SDR family oxidoreductase [Pseudomonas sp. 5Ae-yellow]MBA6418132.1 SDR family oxidoreductase [Pseudomonas sp. 5Ae-yellow]